MILLSIMASGKDYAAATPLYDSLYASIQDSKHDKQLQSHYLASFLRKAQKEKNREEIVNGYRNYMHYSNEKLSVLYADSMIGAAKQSKDPLLIGTAFLSKGIYHY